IASAPPCTPPQYGIAESTHCIARATASSPDSFLSCALDVAARSFRWELGLGAHAGPSAANVNTSASDRRDESKRGCAIDNRGSDPVQLSCQFAAANRPDKGFKIAHDFGVVMLLTRLTSGSW